MPAYDYMTEDGKVVERVFRMADKPKTITLKDGRVARFIYSAPGIVGTTSAGWPYACKSSAVHPSQRDALAKILSDGGVPTQVNKKGQPIYENSSHNKRALAVRGLANYS